MVSKKLIKMEKAKFDIFFILSPPIKLPNILFHRRMETPYTHLYRLIHEVKEEIIPCGSPDNKKIARLLRSGLTVFIV